MSDEHVAEGCILVIGSAGVDIIGRASDPLQPRTSNPGQLRVSHGGVARNVAEDLARLGMDVVLITAVGDDPEGYSLLAEARRAGINTDYCLAEKGQTTGTYLAILDQGGALHLAMDDMKVIEAVTPAHLRKHRALFQEAAAVFVDCNLPPNTLAAAVGAARKSGVPVAADPTSVSLAPRLAPHLSDLWLIIPNEAEAGILCPHPVPHADRDRAIDAARHLVSQGVEIAVIAMAEFGVGYATAHTSGHIPALKTEVVDPTGAGDAMTAAVIFALLNDIPMDEAIRLGASAAALTLRHRGSVVPGLTLELLYDQLR
jgi:pseudouridine kinase